MITFETLGYNFIGCFLPSAMADFATLSENEKKRGKREKIKKLKGNRLTAESYEITMPARCRRYILDDIMGSCENIGFEVVTGSPGETIALGKVIGANLVGGEVVSFVGNLGSGKTHLIKGIAEGLGVDEGGAVNSPTFVLVNEYTGPEVRLDIYHIDAYRLDSVREFEMLGFDDFCYDRSVVLIEWADKVESALVGANPIRIELTHISETQRKIQLKNITSLLLSALKE